MAITSKTRNWPTMSSLFDDDWLKSRFSDDWSPAINVSDNQDNYEIEVAAPGIAKEDFTVSVEKGVLTISGTTEKEKEESEKNYTRKEFSSRSFVRSFTLPDNVAEDQITAKHDDGVLRLVLTKTDKELPPKKEVAIE